MKHSEWPSRAPRKGTVGDRHHTVPEDADASEYGSVVVWCRQFRAPFAAAPSKTPR